MLGILILLLLLGTTAVIVGTVVGAMWFVNWLGAPKVAFALGVAATVLILLTVVQTFIGCAGNPQYFPPVDGDGGEGRMVHACDGPGGLAAYGYAFFAGPLALGALLWLLLCQFRRLRQNSLSADGVSH